MEPDTTFTVSEVSPTYSPSYEIADRPKISSSKDAYDIILSKWRSGA
jgi:DNA repair protein RadC